LGTSFLRSHDPKSGSLGSFFARPSAAWLPRLKSLPLSSVNFCTAAVILRRRQENRHKKGRLSFLEDLTLTKLAGVARRGHTSKISGRALLPRAANVLGCGCGHWTGQAHDEDTAPLCTLLGCPTVEWPLRGSFNPLCTCTVLWDGFVYSQALQFGCNGANSPEFIWVIRNLVVKWLGPPVRSCAIGVTSSKPICSCI
jgi:hypothetical protein